MLSLLPISNHCNVVANVMMLPRGYPTALFVLFELPTAGLY
jgi:hypothetical protein